MARNWDQQLNSVQDWVTVINEYWHKYQGQLHNQSDFWDTVMHSINEQEWNTIYTVTDILSRQYPEIFRRYPGYTEAMLDLNQRLMLGKPVIKRFDRQSWNKAPFKVLMTVKDVLNELNGEPTVEFTEPKQPKPPKPLSTAEEKRRYRREINIQIQETLFEIPND